MAVRAIRGATQVERNDREAIVSGSAELMLSVLQRNDFSPDDLISVIFTATPDLDADFPAHAARKAANLNDVPLLCSTEIPVPGALPRVIRLMAHVETDKPRAELHHVYLHGAVALRSDLPQ